MPFDGVGFDVYESAQKLDAVIDLLATSERWCKGALRSHDGRYCIRGAIRAVNGAELLEPAILQAIGQVAGRRFRRIEAFNDHPTPATTRSSRCWPVRVTISTQRPRPGRQPGCAGRRHRCSGGGAAPCLDGPTD
jgi:hypothetical protein